MKVSIGISVLLFGLASRPGTAAAKSGWFWQNPLPQGNGLAAVAALDATTLVAVGGVGTIVRSNDAGQTWTVRFSGTAENLTGVAFADRNVGAAVGASGTILRSFDGGDSWMRSSTATKSDLNSVCLAGQTADPNNGLVVGSDGKILRTSDDGASWTRQGSRTASDLWGVSFVDANTASVVGDVLLRTTTGGE